MNGPIKYLSLFTGIGAFEKAFERLGIEYELVGYSDIDKYACKAYELIHNVDHSKALGDICQIDTSKLPNDIDMITYGFPCQDISVAGLQRGLTDEEGGYTRSGLFYEALRLIKELKPKYAIAENVKALTSDKFSTEFRTIFQCLDDAGYNNYWQVLNAKDYGIPQNRERVFIVSVRKDIDTGVQFPAPFKLQKRLKDILETDVDESFFLSDKALSKLSFYRDVVRPIDEINVMGKISRHQWGDIYNNNNTVSCLQARDYKTPKLINDSYPDELIDQRYSRGEVYNNNNNIVPTLLSSEGRNPTYTQDDTSRVIQVAGMDRENWKNSQRNRVYDPSGISPTIHTMMGGQLEPCILDDFIPRDGSERIYKDICCTIPANHDVLKVIGAFRGRNPDDVSDRTKGCPTEQRLEINTTGCSNTLTTVQKDNLVVEGVIIGSAQDHAAVKIDGICTTLTSAMGEGGGQIPMVSVNKEVKPKVIAGVGEKQSNKGTQYYQQDRVYDSEQIAITQSSVCNPYYYHNLRIRKLTPKECFRLMGFDDKDCDILVENGISNTQLYKMAGNSIVVNVVEELFKSLFNPSPYGQQRLFI